MDIAFISLGCDKNLVDSEIMLGLVDEKGYKISDDEANADVVVINTCGFILDATSEGIENILEVVENKKNGSVKKIIVTGCMVQRYEKEILNEIPEVDAIIGTTEFYRIGEVIESIFENEEKVIIISDKNKTLDENYHYKRVLTTPSHFAYLKIAEGCDNHCTYCTIPSIRGKFRSRSMESLINETKMLAEQGIKEIILVAQDTLFYGNDLYGEPKIHILIQEISKIFGIEWIRLLYCYPERITDDIINEIKNNEKVLKYIDMPIQHCEDSILKKMARRTSKADLLEVINKLRKEIDGIVLRTTLITGFPNETEEDFSNMLDFVKEVRFERIGAFAYSPEDGTPAANFPNQIDADIKERRKEILLETQNIISYEINQKLIGKTLKVIVDGYITDDDVYCGRSYRDCYEVDGMIFFKSVSDIPLGEILEVKITEGSDYDLIGEVIHEFS